MRAQVCAPGPGFVYGSIFDGGYTSSTTPYCVDGSNAYRSFIGVTKKLRGGKVHKQFPPMPIDMIRALSRVVDVPQLTSVTEAREIALSDVSSFEKIIACVGWGIEVSPDRVCPFTSSYMM